MLEMAQLPSSESPGHANKAKSLVLGWKHTGQEKGPSLRELQLLAGVGFPARGCCCGLCRAWGWGELPKKGPEVAVPGCRASVHWAWAEKRWQALRYMCPAKCRQLAAPAPCLLPRGGRKARGNVGLGHSRKVCTENRDGPSGWAVASPAHYRLIGVTVRLAAAGDLTQSCQLLSVTGGCASCHWGGFVHG